MNKTYNILISLTFAIVVSVIMLLQYNLSPESALQYGYLYAINLCLYLLGFFVAYQHRKAVEAKTNYQFLSKSFFVVFIRMAVIVLLIVIYHFYSTNSIAVSSVLITMLLYFIYSYIESVFLLKGIKKSKTE